MYSDQVLLMLLMWRCWGSLSSASTWGLDEDQGTLQAPAHIPNYV